MNFLFSLENFESSSFRKNLTSDSVKEVANTDFHTLILDYQLRIKILGISEIRRPDESTYNTQKGKSSTILEIMLVEGALVF